MGIVLVVGLALAGLVLIAAAIRLVIQDRRQRGWEAARRRLLGTEQRPADDDVRRQ